jgi:hypothetical protein
MSSESHERPAREIMRERGDAAAAIAARELRRYLPDAARDVVERTQQLADTMRALVDLELELPAGMLDRIGRLSRLDVDVDAELDRELLFALIDAIVYRALLARLRDRAL